MAGSSSNPHPISTPMRRWPTSLKTANENDTPGAYRVFWCYGPDRRQITIVAITPRP